MKLKHLLRISAAAAVLCAGVNAADSVDGELVANGDRTSLGFVTVEASDFEAMLLFTDNELPTGCGVFDAFTLAQAGKIKGLGITIDKETKTNGAGLNGLYHTSWNGLLGNIGEPTVGITRYDDGTLGGSIVLEEGAFAEHKFSYKVNFEIEIPAGGEPIVGTVAGEVASEPAKAYAKFFIAMLANQLDDGKQYVIEENAKQMTGEDAEMFLEFFKETHPAETKINSVKITGETAELLVEGEMQGCMQVEKSSGKVEMVLESGVWKVKAESWE